MPSPPRQPKDFPSPPIVHRPEIMSSPRISRIRKLSEEEKKRFVEVICTPRSSRNRGPKRIYDFLEQKLVLKYVPNMTLSSTSEDGSNSDSSFTSEETHDDINENKPENTKCKRID